MEKPPLALVFEANSIMLRLGMAKELPPADGTVLGRQAPDIVAAVKSLGEPESASSAMRVWAGRTGRLDFAYRREGRLVQGPRRRYLSLRNIRN